MKRKVTFIFSIMAIVIGMGLTGCQVGTESGDNTEPSTIHNATRVPTGNSRKIALKAMASGKFVCADLNINKYGPLFANRDEVKEWETFDFIDLGGDYFALRSYSTGKYVSADKNGTRRLVADAETIGDAEVFWIRYYQYGTWPISWIVCIKYANVNKYIRFDQLCPSEGQDGTGAASMFGLVELE
jgi:hypothetical protein